MDRRHAGQIPCVTPSVASVQGFRPIGAPHHEQTTAIVGTVELTGLSSDSES